MFGKSEPIDSLSHDLSRARNKRDALASDVTTLTTQIADLEARLSAETVRREHERLRREHERVVGEIEGIEERLRGFYLAFANAIAGMRDASVSARAVVPEAPELTNLLTGVATEVANTVDNLLGDLDRRLEVLRASQVHHNHHTPSMSPRAYRTAEGKPSGLDIGVFSPSRRRGK